MKFNPISKISTERMSKVMMALMLSGIVAGGFMPSAWGQAASSNVSQPRLVDEIVAVVNSEIITAQELESRMAVLAARLRQQQVPLPAPDALRRQVLEQMILERVQLQFAKERGIQIGDVVVDRSLAQIAAQNNLNIQELRDHVEREGTTFSRFREDLRNEIIIQRLRERAVAERVRISESEIDQYLAQHAAAIKTQGPELNLLHILVRVPENASPEQVAQLQRRAEQAREQLLKGGDFFQVAAQYSDVASSVNDTNFGWRTADRLPQVFVDAIGQAEPGTVSPLIRSGNGFHLLKLVDKRQAAAAMPAVQQTRARHILIKVNQIVSPEEARRRLAELKERLDNKAASFEELAKNFSNDLSASSGGDLGWIYPGDTVPEFERAMNALKPGEISEPIESPFGYHLIQVLERRTDEVSPERMRMAARNAIYERKMQEAADEWVRELRDRAYVEYRLGGTARD